MPEDLSVASTETAQTQTTEPAAETQPATEATEQPAAQTEQPAEASADPGQSEAETTDTEGEGRKRNNVPAKERIKQLTDRAKAAEARLAELETRQAQHKVEPVKDPLDYANDAEYQKALIKQAVDEVRADTIRQQAEDAARERQEARAEAWNERTSSFREKAADFDQVVYGDHVRITPHMAEAIMGSDTGPDVAYYLGKNPAEARRIAGLPPLAAAVEIGRLSQRFAEPPAAKKVTSAPKPPTTLQGHGSSPSVNYEAMSYEQYRAARAKQ